MLAAGIKSPVPLEELESHLRGEIDEQIHAGLNVEQAFRQVGDARTLKVEFKKNKPANQRKQMLKTLIILAALFGSVFGGALVLPALGRWNHTGVLFLWPLLLGGASALFSGGVAFYAVKSYRGVRGRKLIATGIAAAGCFYMVPLIQSFWMPNVDLAGRAFCGLLALTSLLFYGVCFRLNRKSSLGEAGF
jgi:hypothetical protein